MKVVLVGDFPKDDKTYGGVQGVLVNLANELLLRPEVQLVLVSLTPDSDLDNFKGNFRTYKIHFRNSFFWARKAFNEIVQAEQPDIVHLQGMVPGVLLYRKAFRQFFVVTQHAILGKERQWQVSLKKKALFWFKECVENHFLQRLKHIVFISEYNKNVYFEKPNAKHDLRYRLIPNPVNKTFFKHIASPIDPSSCELYYVGEVKKRKGLHVLIRALHILRQQGLVYRLHIIGGFKEVKYEKEISDLVNSLNMGGQILFCGWKSQEEVMRYTQKIPIFVLPSFQETLPLSIAEAMCQGKIVVATNICGIPEMIKDGHSGYLFTPGDFGQLAGIIKEIFSEMDKQMAVSERAVLEAKKYDSKNIVDQTIDFYKSILNESTS